LPALVPAIFLSRPNRFLLRVRLQSGRRVRAHLADPGRLRELLLPGAALRLRKAPTSGIGSNRSTRYTVALVRAAEPPRPWVCIHSTHANRLAGALLAQGRVPGLGAGWTIRREVTRGRSRFDFLLLRRGEREVLVEVKSPSLVVESVARFPDAPTLRGARHLKELARVVREGGRALVLFIVQREDAEAVAPNRVTDPSFARALASAARAGVLLRAARFRMAASGRATFRGFIPVLPSGGRRNPHCQAP
jgi:sugar fermentation stimulation protein A